MAPRELMNGSARERGLITAVTLLLVALIGVAGAARLLRPQAAWASVFLDVAAALPAVLAMWLAYAALAIGRAPASAGSSDARRAALDVTAPAVAVRLGEVVSTGSGDEVSIDLEVELENFGTFPAVAVPGAVTVADGPSLGFLHERGAVPVRPSSVRPLRLSIRVPATRVRAERDDPVEGRARHRFGWVVTVAVTVTNLGATVTDEIHLVVDLRPFLLAPDGRWTQVADVVAHDPGYAAVVRRSYRDPAVDDSSTTRGPALRGEGRARDAVPAVRR